MTDKTHNPRTIDTVVTPDIYISTYRCEALPIPITLNFTKKELSALNPVETDIIKINICGEDANAKQKRYRRKKEKNLSFRPTAIESLTQPKEMR